MVQRSLSVDRAKSPVIDITGHRHQYRLSQRCRPILCDQIPYFTEAANVKTRGCGPRAIELGLTAVSGLRFIVWRTATLGLSLQQERGGGHKDAREIGHFTRAVVCASS
jgi:hypothetical protein